MYYLICICITPLNCVPFPYKRKSSKHFDTYLNGDYFWVLFCWGHLGSNYFIGFSSCVPSSILCILRIDVVCYILECCTKLVYHFFKFFLRRLCFYTMYKCDQCAVRLYSAVNSFCGYSIWVFNRASDGSRKGMKSYEIHLLMIYCLKSLKLVLSWWKVMKFLECGHEKASDCWSIRCDVICVKLRN